MAKKKPKEIQPPGPFGPIFLGVVSIIIGAGIAFVQLAGKRPDNNEYFKLISVERFMAPESFSTEDGEDPEEEGFTRREPQMVYYLRGNRGGGNTWNARRSELLSGEGPVVITNAELNAWARRYLRVSDEDKGGLLALEPKVPELATTEGLIHFYIPVSVKIFGSEFDTAIIARGELEAGGNGLRFTPAHAYLGSSRVPGIFSGIIYGKIMGAYRESEEYEAIRGGIENISEVKVEPSRITLEI